MQMEEAKEIVTIASTFLAAQEPSAQSIRLEQIEERDGSEWSVVLSFPELSSAAVAAFLGNGGLPHRVYKELVVDNDTKQVRALRFWK